MKVQYRVGLLLLVSWLVACAQDTPTPIPPTNVLETVVAPTDADAALLPKVTQTTVLPSMTPTPPIPPTWPPPNTPRPPLAQTAVSLAEQETFAALMLAAPPERDDVRLAMAFRGLQTRPDLTAPLVTTALTEGMTQTFKIANVDDNTVSEITTILLAVSDHAYFWFDTGPGSFEPNRADLQEAGNAFDDIYETNVFYFGSENNPGIDGDPRVHIVHASPLALCDVTLSTVSSCGLAGYFTSSNVLPTAVDANSNAREMFVMNINQFGSNFYLNVLGHEFRHMIEDRYDRGDTDWEVEGSAVLAEELLSFPSNAQYRGHLFLQNPDQQLNSWTDGNTLSYYGQGYLFNRYLFDRLGVDGYRQFAQSGEPGFLAIDAVAAANGLAITGESLWVDWLVALAIHNEENVPELYQFGGVVGNRAQSTLVRRLPYEIETTVFQYGADYYQLPANEMMTLTFRGNSHVGLLDTDPFSGETMWYAQRGNYSNPRLTRRVDLRQVETATLTYAAYVDIEQGYDFGYVSVSTDGGQTWQGVVGDNMQGAAIADNPAGTALTERFYTGRQQQWVEEAIDLTPYVGQEVQLRFEYVTDLVLTWGGFAIDNIAIPEIGFYDGAETEQSGWTAEGFTRATGVLPQTWYLQLITYQDGIPIVQMIDHTVPMTIGSSEKGPILIVAAAAPLTLQRANYRLELR